MNLDKLKKEIRSIIATKISNIENKITLLKHKNTQNQNEVNQLNEIKTELKNAEIRLQIIDQELTKANKISDCESNHEILASTLGKQQNIIKTPLSNTPKCQEDNK